VINELLMRFKANDSPQGLQTLNDFVADRGFSSFSMPEPLFNPVR